MTMEGGVVEYDDYESLPSTKLSTHLMAGAAAGMMEHCAMFPVDSVKTRMQALRPASDGEYRGVWDAFTRMVRNEGMWTPLRGVRAVALGAGPAHAIYFASYEKCKEGFGTLLSLPSHHPLAAGVAGTLATVVHDGFMNPFDVVKQRMQMHGSPHATVSQCAKAVLRTEGPRAFYRSYGTQLSMNIPYQSIHFMCYEQFRYRLNPAGTYDPLTHVVAGAGAGAMAAAVTTPLDVAKTLLNTQEEAVVCRGNERRYVDSLVQALRTIYETKGMRGFAMGVRARVLFHMPSTALCWSVYEFFKHTITARDAVNGNPVSSGNPASKDGSSGLEHQMTAKPTTSLQAHATVLDPNSTVGAGIS